MYILTNISQDIDGKVYAGHPSFFETEDEAIQNAKENLADDFGINVENIEDEADQMGGKPFVISKSQDGRLETYMVAEMPDKFPEESDPEDLQGFKILNVQAIPFVTQDGTILVPEELEPKDYETYVMDHFDDINFCAPNLDYVGTDLEITEV